MSSTFIIDISEDYHIVAAVGYIDQGKQMLRCILSSHYEKRIEINSLKYWAMQEIFYPIYSYFYGF